MSVITAYPTWYILFCLLAGAVLTFILYRKEALLKEAGTWPGRLLIASRFLVISLLSFLLLSPMIRTFSREVEKPIIMIALDESRSIVNARDSVQRKEQIKKDLEALKDGLSDDYDVRTLSFGDKVRDGHSLAFDDRATDFSMLYNQLDVQFANRNNGALILVTDGLYNEGASPVYGPAQVKVPVFSLALGDTTVRKDIYISAVNHNRIAFLGNAFPLEISVDARQASGAVTSMTVMEDSVQIFSREIRVAGSNYHLVVPVLVDAKAKGIHHYRISVKPVDGEVTAVNNIRDIFVEVIEQKEKILILASAPNPDISAIRQTLEKSPNYEVKAAMMSDFNGSVGDYNLVILHGIPAANGNVAPLMSKLESAGVPVWFILGANTSVDGFNAVSSGLKITQSNGQLNDVQAVMADGFSLFTLSNDLKTRIAAWPPLKSPFGVYQPAGDIYPLLYQKVGSVITSQPLFSFTEKNGRKMAVLAGEGLWRWKLQEFSESGQHSYCDEWINGTVQYLSVKENRSPFRLSGRNNFRENEPLVFDAQLFNQADQLTNEPEVRLRIFNASGVEFPFIMTRSDKAYHLEAGIFPPGNYRYKAEVKLGDKVFSAGGEFSVSALQMETAVTIADHKLLKALAAKTGGTVVYPGQTENLLKSIRSAENLKSVSYMHKKLEDLLNEPWFFVVIIVILSLEWFIRKRAGAY